MAEEVRWTDQALADLDEICAYIALDSPSAAEDFAERAFAATDRLAEFPLSGRVVPEKRRHKLREVVLGNYRIIYRLTNDDVEVITMHHAARQLGDPEAPAPGDR